ncbi:hypothetical protein [Plantibacter sp. ME-Dv--P-122b]|uniref:hypothetical protein n=1 Tax=Plantibacter sp. ME-Dv--P-122b TaxID=3040300 RepID=UPI00254D7863|nr:hypothetical protein [Plantibacter sp. ME-Dv--P-122b]
MSKTPKRTKPPKRLRKDRYEAELERLQIELVTMQRWVIETGARVVVVFEGRDAAGKGGAIKRIVQYLNPRSARVAALPTPGEQERGQWASRLNAIAHLLSQVPYQHRDPKPTDIPDRPGSDTYERPARDRYRYVPDHAHTLGS